MAAREIEAPLTAALLRPGFEDASPRRRLAATVAAFADELRRAMVLARGFDRRDDRFGAELPTSTMGFDEVPILR